MKNSSLFKKMYKPMLSTYLVLLLLANVKLFGQQSSEEINNTFFAKFSVPMLVEWSELDHPTKGRNLKDKFKKNETKTRFPVEIRATKVNINQNGFSGKYVGQFGEEINFSGTLSNDKKMLLKLGVNYSLIKEYPNSIYKTKGRFFVYNLPLNRGHFPLNPPENNIYMFTGKFDKEKTTIDAESYYYYHFNKGNYSEYTEETKLIATDEDYYKTTLPWWTIWIKTTDTTENNAITIKGNSTSYAGYVIAELLKKTDNKIVDLTNEVNKVRKLEASMKDICLPDHKDFAIRTEENLKNPLKCKTTVTINEVRKISNNAINTQIIIENSKIKKELKYTLNYGKTEEDLIKCDELFFSQVDEIVNTILQFTK